MKAAAKYLFDEDFASGEKPTITMVEHERRRVDAESQAYRKGFTAGEAQAQQDATQRTAAALAVIGEGLARLDSALTAIETRLEIEAVEVAVALRLPKRSSTKSRRAVALKVGLRSSRTRDSQQVIAASNGPMAASSATRPRQAQPSMKWSTATYRRAPRTALRNSGDRSNE
jgi:hypothetical protein